MREMSSKQAAEFWKFLHDQAELKKQAFFSTPGGSSYKDEVRTEAETYGWLVEAFSEHFEQPVTGPENITHGLTAEEAASFLHYLDGKISEFEAAQEKARIKRREQLAEAKRDEYFSIRSIFKESENREDRQIGVIKKTRESFMKILQEE